MELNQYLSMFIDESKEHLQALNSNLLQWENHPHELSIVQNIFRSAHTLKGMAGTMGFTDLTNLTHEMENVLDLVRNEKLGANQAMFDVMFRCLDALESMVDDIVAGGTGQADVDQIIQSLMSASNPSEKQEAHPQELQMASQDPLKHKIEDYEYTVLQQSLESGLHVFYIEVTLRDDCVLKAARSYMVFNELEQRGEIVKSVPSAQDIEQENFETVFSLYYVTEVEQEKQIHDWIMNVSEIGSVHVKPIDLAMLQSKTTQNEVAATASPAIHHPVDTPTAPSSRTTDQPTQQAVRTIRVDIDRLDRLMNLFSELLIDRVRLEQLAAEINRTELTETVGHMAQVSNDLQNMVLKMRMVPVDTVFNRFPRMIRDIAKTHNKPIQLLISGADTELDRTVIDEIGDPLVHLLRNAADHGLESGQARVASGKPETGTIHLRAYHSGNHVFIEVEDDGQGISRERVLAKAIQNGLITAADADRLQDKEVYQLLFAPGFSTAEQISDLSGRGVGLDVVKNKITALSGTLEVDSTLGKGTKFSIQLPLTLSIITALLIQAGPEKYAIPLTSIVETISIKRQKINSVHGRQLLDYRNHVIPVISLRQLFDIPVDDQGEPDEAGIAVIRKGDKMAALEVDDFIGQQDIVLKSLGTYLNNLFAISGATILGDGQVALIIDTNAIIK